MTQRCGYGHVARDGALALTLEGSRELLRDALVCERAMRGWHALAKARHDEVLAWSHGEAAEAVESAQRALREAARDFVRGALAPAVRGGLSVDAAVWLLATDKCCAARSIAEALGGVEEAAEVARADQDAHGATGAEPWAGGFEARVRGIARPVERAARAGWRDADRRLAAGESPRDLRERAFDCWASAEGRQE